MKGNKELLEELVNARLDDAMSLCDLDQKSKAFKEAMEAVDRLNEMNKIENANAGKNEKRLEVAIKVVEVAAMPIMLKLIDLGCHKSLINTIGRIEQMEAFTSTPGRAISKMFKF